MHRILRNRVFFVFDLIAWSLTPLLALGLRLDGLAQLRDYWPHLAMFAALGIALKFAFLWKLGLYRRYWRYASIDELILIVLAVVLAGATAALVYFGAVALGVFTWAPRLPRSVPAMDTMLTLILVGGTRFAARATVWMQQRRQGKAVGEPVLIIGAGDAGTMIAKELHANPQLKLDPIGFIDDDPLKQHRTILGLPILGTREDIASVAEQSRVRTAIIAMPTAPGRVIREIRELCDRAGLSIKIIPGVYDIISGRVKVSQLRDVQIEDLLRREPVRTDQKAVAELVRGTRVLVTGAGGSIGREICRQIARLGAEQLILLGHGENSIFEINNELRARHPETQAVPAIADIRDEKRIGRIVDQYRADVIFHAAAHKHVPLMELNPEEAITNNVAGTLNLVNAAERAGVERFVLISTDKAVNPVNIMGATKLVAEMVVHAAAERTQKAFVSVRFGNVLASRGSVVPLFQQQIAAGGPVTVTHPDMMRYFMTIPEAVQLVLQAAAMGKGGETFVLDMGQPVKIADLARDLIKLSGFEVGRDIDIVYTGLRPGEKLYEELFSALEQHERTHHDKIFVARNGSLARLRSSCVTQLQAAATGGDLVEMQRLLAELLPQYQGARLDASLAGEDEIQRQRASMLLASGQRTLA